MLLDLLDGMVGLVVQRMVHFDRQNLQSKSQLTTAQRESKQNTAGDVVSNAAHQHKHIVIKLGTPFYYIFN